MVRKDKPEKGKRKRLTLLTRVIAIAADVATILMAIYSMVRR